MMTWGCISVGRFGKTKINKFGEISKLKPASLISQNFHKFAQKRHLINIHEQTIISANIIISAKTISANSHFSKNHHFG